MSEGFWRDLPRPIMALAPMADVTDQAFRRIILKYGKPDVFWTEFVSADGLCDPRGREHLIPDLAFVKEEHPIVAQLFTGNPASMESAARFVATCGFDGIDINMGCPDRSVEKQGAGAALMKNYDNAKALIRAAKSGAPHIPVSVKIRVGYLRNELSEWLPALLEESPAVVTIHARTRKEMSKVPARWECIREAVAIRDSLKSTSLIFGNGDVRDIREAYERVAQTGCDGVMLGRAIFGNPWLFSDRRDPVTLEERLRVLVEHTELFEKLLGEIKNFSIMKKHYKAYVTGFDGAKELRVKLMETASATEVRLLVEEFLAAGGQDRGMLS